MSAVSLVSLNIERDKHWTSVDPFLEREKPDVLCLQELLERDIPRVEASGMKLLTFAPMSSYDSGESAYVFGVSVFARLECLSTETHWYSRSRSITPTVRRGDPSTYNDKNSPLVVCDVVSNGTTYRIATTHFRWTPDGNVSEEQRTDLAELLKILNGLGELVLCGDFNAPRGKEIFAVLANLYKDNIPASYTTSIDRNLHRAGPVDAMVDGLFTTPGYMASDVAFEGGVSDHFALKAVISKAGGG